MATIAEIRKMEEELLRTGEIKSQPGIPPPPPPPPKPKPEPKVDEKKAPIPEPENTNTSWHEWFRRKFGTK